MTPGSGRLLVTRVRIKLKYGTPWLVKLRCRVLVAQNRMTPCTTCGRRWVYKRVAVGGGSNPEMRHYCDRACVPTAWEDR